MLVKKLVRKHPINFVIRPMVSRNLHPLVDRASFIRTALNKGVTYQAAIREFDKRVKLNG